MGIFQWGQPRQLAMEIPEYTVITTKATVHMDWELKIFLTCRHIIVSEESMISDTFLFAWAKHNLYVV